VARALRSLALATVSTLIVAGCASADLDPCAAESIALEATVTEEAMDPSGLAVCRGQAVTLELNSQTDGEFHLHGYDEQVPATNLVAGETTTLEFTADVAGQFIIELHSGGNEAEIGVLTVNEP
jgi:hypothetical protein